jgi:methyl-accepting chemotaxis protein
MFNTAQALFDSLFPLDSTPQTQLQLLGVLSSNASRRPPARRRAGGGALPVKSIHQTRSVAEYTPGGRILGANAGFLETMGYSRDEVLGEHHRLFVEEQHAWSEEYRVFWETLRQGGSHTGQFRRISREGTDVWLQATYYPVFGPEGAVEKVTEIAIDLPEADDAEAE